MLLGRMTKWVMASYGNIIFSPTGIGSERKFYATSGKYVKRILEVISESSTVSNENQDVVKEGVNFHESVQLKLTPQCISGTVRFFLDM